MDADFMALTCQDRRHHLGVQHDAHCGNEERGRHLVPIEEVEELPADPRGPDGLPNLLLRGIDGDRIHGRSGLVLPMEVSGTGWKWRRSCSRLPRRRYGDGHHFSRNASRR